MAFFNPLQGLIGDTRTDPNQVSARTGRSLQDDMNSPDLQGLVDKYGQQSFSPMRGGLPNWAPGEFDEWKMGKLTGLGTAFGRERQKQYDMRNIPGLYDMSSQERTTMDNPISENISAALEGLMRRFR